MGISGVLCAVQAGSCAAMASVCAKLAASSETAYWLAAALCLSVQKLCGVGLQLEDELAVVLRLTGVAGIFLFNALMWVLFTKSMHLCASTLEATAFNTSSNFICTAVIGKLLFGEHLGWLWFVGSALIVIGLTILHKGSSSDDDKGDESKDGATMSSACDIISDHHSGADKKLLAKKDS